MVDVGGLPVILLLALYFAAQALRAPRWLKTGIAIPMGITSLWALAFGVHIWVIADLGHQLNNIVPVIGMVAALTLLIRLICDRPQRSSDRAADQTGFTPGSRNI